MVRKIITIDPEKCNGCGLCAAACHEGAIGMKDGKAVLLRDDYCDGLGDCLPVCPTEAIRFVEREAAAYDESAVKKNQAEKANRQPETLPCGCPGTQSKALRAKSDKQNTSTECHALPQAASRLNQWPVQIKLVPVNAPYFDHADILIAADCTAYACGHFHQTFMRDKITLIGCPKLDSGDYSEKLSEIFKNNIINSVTVARMEVPCCGGLVYAVEKALTNCGKSIPHQVVTIGTDGAILP